MDDCTIDVSACRTVADLFVERVKRSPRQRALGWFTSEGAPVEGCKTDSIGWYHWQDLASEVCQWAAALSVKGIGRGDIVMLVSENRPEWIFADLAIQLLGAVNVPLHAQTTPRQALDLASHCQPKLILASTQSQWGKFAGSEFDERSFAFVDSVPASRRWSRLCRSTPGWTWSSLVAHTRSIDPKDLLSILYTSGTTGEPKGVMLSHHNVLCNVRSKLQTLPLTARDTRLCMLPLSHIFARVCDLYTGIASGCQTVLSRGWDSLMTELREVRPTYLNAVPYFYEKCYRSLEREARLDEPGALRNLLGGHTRVCNCGGAPLAAHVYEYFHKQRVGLVTGYGLTETSPVVTSQRLDDPRPGSVGPPIPDVEVCIARDGEVLVRGTNVMQGYWREPEATAGAFTGEWFHTGDLGWLDEAGHLYLTGRKKELIVTTGGKNIAPIPIEHALTMHPAIEQAAVFGDRRDFLVALVVPNKSWCEGLLANSTSSARRPVGDSAIAVADRNSTWTSAPERRMIEEALFEVASSQLRDFSKYEQIGRLAVIEEPFSIDNGLLTPKKSLRRERVHAAYAEIIDQLYQQPK